MWSCCVATMPPKQWTILSIAPAQVTCRNWIPHLPVHFLPGTHPSAILTRSLMHFSNLREMRAAFDNGATTSEIVNSGRNRVHFSRKAAMERQIRSWSARNLANACERIQETVLATRKNPNLDLAHTRQALLAIATIAARN